MVDRMIKNKIRETVLYYTPEESEKTRLLKGVLVRMGIRIKNVSAEQTGQTVGSLLGLHGYEEKEEAEERALPLPQEMLVMHQFSSRRLDELLFQLRKAGVPKIELKAMVTETNVKWTFQHLYEELQEEHEAMSGKKQE